MNAATDISNALAIYNWSHLAVVFFFFKVNFYIVLFI